MPEESPDERVLVLMPAAQDAERTRTLLAAAGMACATCADVEALCRELAAGAGVVLLTDEAVIGLGADLLKAALSSQPAWSDLPLVVLTREGAEVRHAAFRESANATLVERPVRMRTLLSVVRAALRARRHQYEVRDLLAERHRAAEALMDERERLRITLASIGDAVISTDAAGRVTFLNPVAEALTGWPQAEAEGRPLTEVFHIVNEDTRQEVENPALRALREGTIVGLANHTVLISRGGAERPIDDSAAPIRGEAGYTVGSVLVFRDITERRRAGAALRASEARYRAIVEATPECVKLVAPDGTLLQMNRAGLAMVEGDEGALGQCVYNVIAPEDRDRYRAFNERICRGERGALEFDIIGLKGTRRHMETAAVPLPDANGGFNHLAVTRDATERRDAELERARLHARVEADQRLFDAVFDALPVGLVVAEPGGRLVRMNRANEELWGSPPETNSIAEYEPWVGYWPDTGRRIEPHEWALARVLTAGERVTGDLVEIERFHGGGRRHVLISGAPARDADGRVVAGVIAQVDVTDRRRAESQLREKDERLQLFLGNATDYAVIITDPEDLVLEWLGGAEQIMGWRADEVLGKPVSLIFTPEDQKAGVPARETTKAAEVGRAENVRWHQRKDGSLFFAEGVTVAVRGPGGELRGFGKVFRDATARKLAEERLTRDAMLLANVQDAVVMTDLAGIVTYWNEGADRLFGWAPEEMVGRHYADRFEEPLRSWVAAEIRERASGSEWSGEYEDYRKDGSRVWIDARVTSIRDAGGTVVGVLGVSHDISERKQAEAALRAGEERFRSLFESMDEGYCVVEPVLDAAGRPVDYRYLLANPALEHHTGLRDVVGKTAREIMPGHESNWIETYARVAATGEPIRRTDRVEDLGRWYDVAAFPVGGGQVGVLFADVTARRVAEEGLRASEARLAEIFRHAPSFMCVLSGPDHVFERVNDRYLELIGGRDVVGMPVLEALPEVEGQGYFEMLDRVYRSGEPYAGTDQRVVLARGGRLEERFLDFVYQPIRDVGGAVTGVLAQGIDTTERKRAELALRERDERLQLAVAIARMGTFVIDLATDAVTVNEPGRDIYGWADTRTTFAQVQTHFHPDDKDEVMRQVEARIDPAGPGIFEVEQRIIRTDGAVRWLRVRGRALFEGAGEARQAVLCIGAYLDVTDQKEAEEQLRDADRKKDDFIALLAHELRNPLAPIRNGLGVLRMAGADEEAVRETREIMERQITHMVRLIDDLLDVSRINRNKMELRLSKVTLAEAVNSALETARPVIDAGEHALTVSIPDRPLYLEADPVRLAQVFSNLLTNSAKYTRHGGKIWLTAERSGESVAVSVRDNGIGIPAAALENIFDMFSQVDRSVERATGGLGIGLALVKGLVEMHGGTVAAASGGEGKGSMFTVTLPVIATPAPATRAPKSNGRAGSGRRILIVDDSPDGANTLARMLRLMGNDVRTANDGLEGVETAGEFLPEVVLMDIGMPLLNGLDATRRIREQEWGREMTIIALTGWGQEGDKERSREAGCDGHLVKPVDLDDLEKLLGASRSAR